MKLTATDTAKSLTTLIEEAGYDLAKVSDNRNVRTVFAYRISNNVSGETGKTLYVEWAWIIPTATTTEPLEFGDAEWDTGTILDNVMVLSNNSSHEFYCKVS